MQALLARTSWSARCDLARGFIWPVIFLGWKWRLASGIILLRLLHFIDLSFNLFDSHGRKDKIGGTRSHRRRGVWSPAIKLTMNVSPSLNIAIEFAGQVSWLGSLGVLFELAVKSGRANAQVMSSGNLIASGFSQSVQDGATLKFLQRS